MRGQTIAVAVAAMVVLYLLFRPKTSTAASVGTAGAVAAGNTATASGTGPVGSGALAISTGGLSAVLAAISGGLGGFSNSIASLLKQGFGQSEANALSATPSDPFGGATLVPYDGPNLDPVYGPAYNGAETSDPILVSGDPTSIFDPSLLDTGFDPFSSLDAYSVNA